MDPETTPTIVRRPKLALWMFERGLKPRDAEGPLGVGAEQVRRYCLPFADPMQVTPPPKVMRRIVEWTLGDCTANDWLPDDLLASNSDESDLARREAR